MASSIAMSQPIRAHVLHLRATRAFVRKLHTRPASKTHRTQSRVLVVGGGPAGSTTAYFLAKAGFAVTVAERSTRPPYGQGIDITHQAIDVVRRMNLLEKIKQRTTGETGFALLNDQGKEVARLEFNASESQPSQARTPASPTNEIEIMRGTLTRLIADAAKELQVNYRYGCTVDDIEQHQDSISAVLSDTKQSETYSAIIGADGVFSQVRRLGFPADLQRDCIKPTNSFSAYFSMAVDKTDRVNYSRFQHGGKGRGIWLRPIDRDGTRASGYFITMSPDNKDLQRASSTGATEEQQKDTLAQLHSDMSGIRETAVRGMRECTDWHFTRVVQVKLPTWHIGRCGLVGDAAYCPSPLTGQGTCMALMGAYIIAGELAAHPDDPGTAFAQYKSKFERYVKEQGEIPLGGRGPAIFNPQSAWGVWLLRQAFSGFAKGYGNKLFNYVTSFSSGGKEDKFRLPVYPI